jgi:Na+-driven multidrug efflux pump
MLSVITLLDLGVGAVVQAALYKPLLNNDNERISAIYYSAKRYFNIIAWILVIYVLALCTYYGIFKTSAEYSWIFTTTLILSISINYFAQYYFGICNTLLLNADQRIYIVTIVNLLGLILNAAATIILIGLGSTVQIVQLASSVVFLIKPIILQIYVRKIYDIHKPKIISGDSLPNRWSGLAQHIATTITTSVDTVILTLASSFQFLSVYHVYVMPLNSIRNLIEITSTSFKSYFGNIYAKGDKEELIREFDTYETAMHFVVSVVFSTVLVTLVPFALVYTNVVTDINYRDELFSILITVAYAIYSLRVTYTNIIFSAGKFRETQSYSIVEVILNVAISVILVFPLGLSGVAIGTAISSFYRLLMSVIYLSKDVLHRKIMYFLKKSGADCVCYIAIILISKCFYFSVNTFFDWVVYAAIVFLSSLVIAFAVFSLLLRDSFNVVKIVQRIKSKG